MVSFRGGLEANGSKEKEMQQTPFSALRQQLPLLVRSFLEKQGDMTIRRVDSVENTDSGVLLLPEKSRS